MSCGGLRASTLGCRFLDRLFLSNELNNEDPAHCKSSLFNNEGIGAHCCNNEPNNEPPARFREIISRSALRLRVVPRVQVAHFPVGRLMVGGGGNRVSGLTLNWC